MRIAVVSNTAWNLFNFRLNLMRELQAAGHEVIGVAPHDDYVERIRAAGFPVEVVPISGDGTNPLTELGSVQGLWRAFRRRRVELALSYTPKGNLYTALACLASGRAFVPNVSGLGRTFISKSAATHVVSVLYRLTLRHGRRVFFQNATDLQTFVERGLVPSARAGLLPGSGVDLRRFTPRSLPSAPGQGPVFLLIARMLWDKGVGEFVDAARTVRRQVPGARFRLLGSLDVDNPSTIAAAQVHDWVQEGVIEYLGVTDDVRDAIAQADAVVLPSYREGMPRTLLEAAAMGRPVITSDAPGCRDAVLDGQTGFVCGTRSATDLADKLLRFAALSPEHRHAMGRAGRAFVEARFDERLVVARYLEVVSEVAGGTAAPHGAAASASRNPPSARPN